MNEKIKQKIIDIAWVIGVFLFYGIAWYLFWVI